jgi:hypothetical protein
MSKIRLRWLNFSGRASNRRSTVNELTQRIHRAAESILENERLTADLDDAAAKVLLDWGIACAKMVARSTVGLDDAEAKESMSPRLRATRRLMRLVNRWIASRPDMDAEGGAMLLTDIIEQAAIIYDKDWIVPSDNRRDAFLRQGLVGSPVQFILNLHKLIENIDGEPAANSGGIDDRGEHNQEIYRENDDGETCH